MKNNLILTALMAVLVTFPGTALGATYSLYQGMNILMTQPGHPDPATESVDVVLDLKTVGFDPYGEIALSATLDLCFVDDLDGPSGAFDYIYEYGLITGDVSAGPFRVPGGGYSGIIKHLDESALEALNEDGVLSFTLACVAGPGTSGEGDFIFGGTRLSADTEAVPIPPALLMLGSGLILLAGFRKKSAGFEVATGLVLNRVENGSR